MQGCIEGPRGAGNPNILEFTTVIIIIIIIEITWIKLLIIRSLQYLEKKRSKYKLRIFLKNKLIHLLI